MKTIIDLYKKIIKRKGLELDSKRTILFGNLIGLIKDNHLTYDKEIDSINNANLQKVFSIEQTSIEKNWSKKLIRSKSALSEIKLFPFYKGYVSSAAYLYNTIASISRKKIKKILYIGSGALPLNSILIAQNYNLVIDNIERDFESYKLSCLLLTRLKLDKQIKVIHKDIIDFKTLNNYDVIICAILVGSNTKEKQKIINHIAKYMEFGNFLLLKNVDGLRTILYPPIDITKLPKGLHIESIVKKQSELTNILIVAKKIGN